MFCYIFGKIHLITVTVIFGQSGKPFMGTLFLLCYVLCVTPGLDNNWKSNFENVPVTSTYFSLIFVKVPDFEKLCESSSFMLPLSLTLL